MQLRGEYAGVFWSANDLGGAIGTGMLPETYEFSTEGFTFVIGIGTQHTESVLAWLDSLHAQVVGSSMLVAVVAPDTTQHGHTIEDMLPQVANLQHFTAPPPTIRHMTDQLAGRRGILLADPLTDEFYLLSDAGSTVTPGVLGIELLRPPVINLALVRTTVTSAEVAKPKRRYDPIAAQIGEIRYRKAPSILAELSDLLTFAKSLGHPELAADVARAIEETEQQLLKLDMLKGGDNKLLLFSHTDHVAHHLDALADRVAWLRERLRDYEVTHEDWLTSRHYRAKMSGPMLTILRRVADELIHRISGSRGSILLPVYDRAFWILTHPLLSNVSAKTSFLGVPRSLMFRIGGFPVLAHEIAHLAMPLPDRSLTDAVGDLMGVEAQPEVLRRHCEELLADAIAAIACGPAYLFAFSRFALGTLAEMTGKRKGSPSSTHPSMELRLRVCISLLSSVGFSHGFASEYVGGDVPEVPEPFINAVTEAVVHPYSMAEHDHATSYVLDRLVDGQVVDEAPIVLLNALWHAVSTGGQYLNELALAMSLRSERV